MENQEITNVQTRSNIVHYAAYSLLTLGLLVLAYINFMPQKSLLETSTPTTAQSMDFKDLPSFVQLQYRPIQEFDKVEEKLDGALKQIAMLQEEKSPIVQESQKNDSSIEPKPQEELHPSSSSVLPMDNASTTSPTRINDFAKCYDMEVGKYAISKQCHKNIIAFVDKHKNAQFFEIIGIVDETEFTLFKNLENNNFIYDKLNVTQNTIDIMKKLSQSGLAKYRATEATWVIKSHTQKKAQVYNANYNLLSNDGKKGFVLRAYQ